MDDVLRRALEPVLSDIRSTGAPRPRVEDKQWDSDPGVSSAMLWAADDSRRGISTRPGLSALGQIVAIADQVQEWVIEERWSEGSNWPPCPIHPRTHPMTPAVVSESAQWVCPISGTPFGTIGQL